MRSGDLAYWLVWGAGTLTFVVCVGILWWGLFGDRARGRRRCPKCWYDMSHTPGSTCPECGRTQHREKLFFQTRRRLVPALLAAIIASAGASYAIERGNQRGWLALMPTRLMLMSLPLSGDASSLTAEIQSRLGRGAMSEGQLHTLVKRCLRGDMLARPVTPAWERKYGALLAHCRGALPDEFDLDDDLLRLPARIELTNRRSWPAGVPICLFLDVREWWPAGTECRVHLTPAWNPDEPIVVWRDAAPRWGARPGLRNRNRMRTYPLIIHDPPGDSRLSFDITLERLVPGGGSAWEEIQDESITVDVNLTGTLATTLQPSTNEELAAAMRSTFDRGVVKWIGGRSPVRVSFNRQHTYGLEEPEDIVIGAAVEIVHQDTLARRLELWWPLVPSSRDDIGFVVAYEDEELIKGANDEDGEWHLHVRGAPAIALRAGAGSTYWDGEFAVPLSVREIETIAPRKYWWREQDGVSR